LLGFRVRRFDDPSRRLSVLQSYGSVSRQDSAWVISFFAMGFNEERRALHDFAAGSIVVVASSLATTT